MVYILSSSALGSRKLAYISHCRISLPPFSLRNICNLPLRPASHPDLPQYPPFSKRTPQINMDKSQSVFDEYV